MRVRGGNTRVCVSQGGGGGGGGVGSSFSKHEARVRMMGDNEEAMETNMPVSESRP